MFGGVATILPNKGSIIQFTHYERLQDMPFAIYADFESYLEPCVPQECLGLTRDLQRHIPAAFGYYIVCSYNDTLNKYVSYRGFDCTQKFIQYLSRDISEIYNILKQQTPMIFTQDNLKDFIEAKDFYLFSSVI